MTSEWCSLRALPIVVAVISSCESVGFADAPNGIYAFTSIKESVALDAKLPIPPCDVTPRLAALVAAPITVVHGPSSDRVNGRPWRFERIVDDRAYLSDPTAPTLSIGFYRSGGDALGALFLIKKGEHDAIECTRAWALSGTYTR